MTKYLHEKLYSQDGLFLTISDLFFNSHEVECLTDKANKEDIQEQASAWLEMYPYFKQYITAYELRQDFLNRL
jgi:hypothetical protein